MKEKENGHIWILNGLRISRQEDIAKNSIFFSKNLNKTRLYNPNYREYRRRLYLHKIK